AQPARSVRRDLRRHRGLHAFSLPQLRRGDPPRARRHSPPRRFRRRPSGAHRRGRHGGTARARRRGAPGAAARAAQHLAGLDRARDADPRAGREGALPRRISARGTEVAAPRMTACHGASTKGRSMLVYALILATALCAGALSGIIGTGSSIILLPLLVYQFGPKQAVPI